MMPGRRGAQSAATPPTRRSPRTPASGADQNASRAGSSEETVRVRFNESSSEKNRRRVYSRSRNGATPDTPTASGDSEEPGNSSDSSNQLPTQHRSPDKKVDSYCWLCHTTIRSDDDAQDCIKCPRACHKKCLRPSRSFAEDGTCMECRRTSVDGAEVNKMLKDQKLSELLLLVLDVILKNSPVFRTWPCTSQKQNSKLVCIRDLSVVEDRLNLEDMGYSNTAEFLADIKWIHHNCCIAYGLRNPLTTKAAGLVKLCKIQLINLEACPECYLRSQARDENFFTKVCSIPHIPVWVKLRGYPFWPAKVLKVIDKKASVMFFGSHDRSRVSISECYHLTEENPGDKKPTKDAYAVAKREVAVYVQSLVERDGKFSYASGKIPFAKPFQVGTRGTHSATAAKSHAHHRLKRSRNRRISRSPSGADQQSEDVLLLSSEGEMQSTVEPSDNEIEVIEERGAWNQGTNGIGDVNGHGDHAPGIEVMDANSQHFHSPTHVEMDFVVEGRDVEEHGADAILEFGSMPGEASQPSPENVISGIIDEILNVVTSGPPQYLSHEDAAAAGPGNEPEVEVVHSTYMSPTQNTAAGMDIDLCMIGEQPATSQDMYSLPPHVTAAKYAEKAAAAIQSIIQEMWTDLVNIPPVQRAVSILHKEIEDMRDAKAKSEQRADEIKKNADLVIKKMRKSFETEKQRAVEEARISWKLELEEVEKSSSRKIEEVKAELENSYQERLDKVLKDFKEQLLAEREQWEAKHKMEVEQAVASAREGMVPEAVVEARLQQHIDRFEAEKTNAIDETKKHQWCRYCWKKAYFQCCWNTNYCDSVCQRMHWLQHIKECTRDEEMNKAEKKCVNCIKENGSVMSLDSAVQPAGSGEVREQVEEQKYDDLPQHSSPASETKGHSSRSLKRKAVARTSSRSSSQSGCSTRSKKMTLQPHITRVAKANTSLLLQAPVSNDQSPLCEENAFSPAPSPSSSLNTPSPGHVLEFSPRQLEQLVDNMENCEDLDEL